MNCKICGRKNISASMGGADICGWCDCGGMTTVGTVTYIRLDMIKNYKHLIDKKEEVYKGE